MLKTEQIARGIIFHEGKILLCKSLLSGGHYFLPGGHIEEGESAEIAFTRELQEEIGKQPTKIKNIAEIKNSYMRDGKQISEVFSIFLTKLDSNEDIKSKESHLAFEWVSVKDLPLVNFKPKQAISDIVKSIQENQEFWEERGV